MNLRRLSFMELCDLYADKRASEGPLSAGAALAKLELERRESVMLDLISGRSEEAKTEAKRS